MLFYPSESTGGLRSKYVLHCTLLFVRNRWDVVHEYGGALYPIFYFFIWICCYANRYYCGIKLIINCLYWPDETCVSLYSDVSTRCSAGAAMWSYINILVIMWNESIMILQIKKMYAYRCHYDFWFYYFYAWQYICRRWRSQHARSIVHLLIVAYNGNGYYTRWLIWIHDCVLCTYNWNYRHSSEISNAVAAALQYHYERSMWRGKYTQNYSLNNSSGINYSHIWRLLKNWWHILPR